MPIQINNAEKTGLERTQLQPRFDPIRSYARAIGLHQLLLGLRGFWPISSADDTGALYDISGQGRTLTYTGNPTLSLDTGSTLNHIFPYAALDGTGDYWTRADEAGLDILGTETYIAAAYRGLTMGCWVRFDGAAAAVETIMSKWNAGVNQRSYRLSRLATGVIRFQVSVDGTAETNQDTTTTIGAATWAHVIGRFDPASQMSVFINGVETSAATLTASIFNSTSAFRLGANGAAGELLTGRIALPFLCAAWLPDGMCKMLYHDARAMFNKLT